MRTVIISSSDGFREQLHAACLRFPDSMMTLRVADSIGQGIDLAEKIEAEIIILDLSNNIEAGLAAIEELSSVFNRVVIVSADYLSSELIMRAINAGAREVLEQPANDDSTKRMLNRAKKILGNFAEPIHEKPGKLTVCFSSKGGVGKTTLACSIAVLLARSLDDEICLVDANQQVPNIASMLNIRPDRWLKDVITEYKKMDGQMLEQYLYTHDSSLKILPHDGELPFEEGINEDQLCKLLLVCKSRFKHTIVDTFPLLTNLNLAVMDLAERIILITEPTVPALRTAKINLDLLQQAGYGHDRLEVVINKRTDGGVAISSELASETLNWPINYIIDFNPEFIASANKGVAFVDYAPKSREVSQITQLVGNLFNIRSDSIKTKNNGLLAKIYSLLE